MNNLSGEIPSLICNLNLINYLDFSHNHFSMITPCLRNMSDLINLDLGNNNLHGTTPKFVKCSNLRSLKLASNQLEGSLPCSLVRCKKLKILDISNKVNDTFPCWLVNLLELWVLLLQSNNFHGSIGNHKTKFSFPNLRIIDLSHNMFHGHLPSNFFKNLTAMMNGNVEKGKLQHMGDTYYHDSITIDIKGNYIDVVKIHTLLTTIDFSNNSFKGDIPKIIGKLGSLKGLNFSHNSYRSYTYII